MAAPKRPFASYEDRLSRVLTHIYENLEDDLDIDRLAEIANMSPYHWHRVFRAMTGETILGNIRRLRLIRAANDLVLEDTPLREVAARVGYKNLSSFSRAFKRAHGLSPNDFRVQGQRVNSLLDVTEHGEDLYPVHFSEQKVCKAAGVLQQGPYRLIGKSFKTLGSKLMSHSLTQDVSELFVIYHDPPEAKPDAELRAHVAVTILDSFPGHLDGLEYFDICGGTYAILEHTGPYGTLKSAYDWLYGHWVPRSGFELRDAPPLEVYISDPRTTPSAELRTDIRVPLL